MSEFRTSQDWTTATTGAAGGTIIQDLARIIDAGGEEALNVRLELRSISGGTLTIKTAASYDGPWLTTQSFTVATDQVVPLLTHFAASSTNRLRRYVRWEFTAAGAGHACFRLTYASGVLPTAGR